LNDEDSAKSSDSEPEMFDNVMETSARPMVIDDSDNSDEPTPIKKPAPAKRKLGPKPPASKRKIVSSDSEATPVKKKVCADTRSLDCVTKSILILGSRKQEKEDRVQ
jgi:hypothetical protein